MGAALFDRHLLHFSTAVYRMKLLDHLRLFAVFLLCLFWLQADGQERDKAWEFRETVLARIHKFPIQSSPAQVLDCLRASFLNIHYLSPQTNLWSERLRQGDWLTNEADWVSVAYATNSFGGSFFVRPDFFDADVIGGTRFTTRMFFAPIFIVSKSGRLTIFDAWNDDALFSQNRCFFHGFITRTNSLPSLVASEGPVGTASGWTCYRFDFIADRTGKAKVHPHILLDKRGVTDFVFDVVKGKWWLKRLVGWKTTFTESGSLLAKGESLRAWEGQAPTNAVCVRIEHRP